MIAGNLFPQMGLEVQLHSPHLPLYVLDCAFDEFIRLGAADGRGLMDGPPHGLLPARLAARKNLFRLSLLNL